MSLICGEVLKRLRLKNGLNQETFGKIMGWGFAVRHLEKNQTKFTRVHLEQLIHAGFVIEGDRFWKAFTKILDKEKSYDLSDIDMDDKLTSIARDLSNAISEIDHNPQRIVELKIDLLNNIIEMRRESLDFGDVLEEMTPEEAAKYLEELPLEDELTLAEDEIQVLEKYRASKRAKIDESPIEDTMTTGLPSEGQSPVIVNGRFRPF